MAWRGLRGWAAGSGWEGPRRAGGGTGLGARAGTAAAAAAAVLAAGAAAGAQTGAAGALRAAARGAGVVAAEHRLKGGTEQVRGHSLTSSSAMAPALPLPPPYHKGFPDSRSRALISFSFHLETGWPGHCHGPPLSVSLPSSCAEAVFPWAAPQSPVQNSPPLGSLLGPCQLFRELDSTVCHALCPLRALHPLFSEPAGGVASHRPTQPRSRCGLPSPNPALALLRLGLLQDSQWHTGPWTL